MSMVVNLQSPDVTLTFDEDAGNGVLVSLDPVSSTRYGVYAPGAVEISSASSVTRSGVTRTNISVRVPLCSFDTSGNLILDNSVGNKRGQNKPKFVQASLTISIPNAAGLVGSAQESAGVPQNQISANLAATSLALQILCNLIGKQAALTEGESVISPSTGEGAFDSHNPVARGSYGLIPVDPNADRDLISHGL